MQLSHAKPTIIATLTMVAAASMAAADAGPIRLLDARDLVWETTPEGVAFAALQGDRHAGPYQALVKLPAGTVSPPHIKSAAMFGVMQQGQMIHYGVGENPERARRMGPGSFYEISGGAPHISACISDTPCIVYLYQDGAFDFLPVSQ